MSLPTPQQRKLHFHLAVTKPHTVSILQLRHYGPRRQRNGPRGHMGRLGLGQFMERGVGRVQGVLRNAHAKITLARRADGRPRSTTVSRLLAGLSTNCLPSARRITWMLGYDMFPALTTRHRHAKPETSRGHGDDAEPRGEGVAAVAIDQHDFQQKAAADGEAQTTDGAAKVSNPGANVTWGRPRRPSRPIPSRI